MDERSGKVSVVLTLGADEARGLMDALYAAGVRPGIVSATREHIDELRRRLFEPPPPPAEVEDLLKDWDTADKPRWRKA